MHLEDLLREFGHRAGMDAPAPGPDGVCRLTFDSEYDVDLEPRGRELCLTATVGPLDEEQGEGLLRRLLAANLTDAAAGAALALDIGRNEVVLHRRLALDGLDFARFEEQLRQFLDYLAACRRLVDGEEPEAQARPAGPAEREEDHLRIRV